MTKTATTQCAGCHRTEERTERGKRQIKVNASGICRACAESAAEHKDELNPVYMFQMTRNELLVKIASGEINPVELAKNELAMRGLDIRTGKWVGFDRAKETAKMHTVRGANGKTAFVSVPD